MVLVLALAAAAIYGIVILIRRSQKPREDPTSTPLRVLARAPLGASRSVYAVAVGTQGWLVGTGEGGVSLIAEIQDKDALNAMLLDESRQAAASPERLSFARILENLRGGGGDGGLNLGADRVRKSRERLKGL
jgi:flagellar biogenesis protein FliO